MNESKIFQLDFWKDEKESELDSLRERIEAIGDSSTKVRKGTYAKIGDLNKKMMDLENRMLIIEQNICKGV